jgi:hypothetical protein
MAREPILVVNDPGINGAGSWFGQRRDDAASREKPEKAMDAVQVIIRERHCTPETAATALVRLKAGKGRIADLTEPNVDDREPRRKMAGAIEVTANGQRRVRQRH